MANERKATLREIVELVLLVTAGLLSCAALWIAVIRQDNLLTFVFGGIAAFCAYSLLLYSRGE